VASGFINLIVPLVNQNRWHYDESLFKLIQEHRADHKDGFAETHLVGDDATSNDSTSNDRVCAHFIPDTPLDPIKLMLLEAEAGLGQE
jgi:hypothetical protein